MLLKSIEIRLKNVLNDRKTTEIVKKKKENEFSIKAINLQTKRQLC